MRHEDDHTAPTKIDLVQPYYSHKGQVYMLSYCHGARAPCMHHDACSCVCLESESVLGQQKHMLASGNEAKELEGIPDTCW
jgi:hypothetical protein